MHGDRGSAGCGSERSHRSPCGADHVHRSPPLLISADPLDLALDASREVWQGASCEPSLPRPFCAEVGRRLLLAEMQFSSWVLRRVEKIVFEDDRNVLREMSVELNVREDAPVFVDDAGHAFWAVPVMMMRRRTLVDFHMHAEDGRPIGMPGLRLVQQLDQSLLLAAAAAVTPDLGRSLAEDDEVQDFVRHLVAGSNAQVRREWKRYSDLRADETGPLATLRRSALFHSVARQLRSSFSLYVFLPVSPSRHRLLRLSFVEPIRWNYQKPVLKDVSGTVGTCGAVGTWRYRAGRPVPWHRPWSHVFAALGWTATRLRFQVPSAERAASYHVEVVAPPGVRIGGATLIAGRPNADGRPRSDDEVSRSRITVDHEESATLTVGLHGVEVPPGSLCRAQIDMRVQSSGWLASMVATATAITAVLTSVAWHYHGRDTLGPDEDTNVVVLLLTTAAAAAALVAHREFGGVAGRLLVGVRMVAAACTALPVVAAGFVTFTQPGSASFLDIGTGQALTVITVAALLLTVQLLLVWVLSRRVERSGRRRSPWNMTPDTSRRPWWHRGSDTTEFDDDDVADDTSADDSTRPFTEVLTEYQFDRPALGIPSSDAWHEWYDVTDSRHEAAVAALEALAPGTTGSPAGVGAVPAQCPRHDRSGSSGDQQPRSASTRCCQSAGPAAALAWCRARQGPLAGAAPEGTRPLDASYAAPADADHAVRGSSAPPAVVHQPNGHSGERSVTAAP